MQRKPSVGYMCRVDFEVELGDAIDGNKIYPSIEALKEHHPATDECGIVEVKVEATRIVEPGTVLGGKE